MFFVVGEQFGSGAAAEFFEFFGQLARHAKLSILQCIDRSGAGFDKAIR